MMDTIMDIVFFCGFITMSLLFWLQGRVTSKSQKTCDEAIKLYEQTVDKYVNLSHDYCELSEKYQKLLIKGVMNDPN